MPIPEDLQPEDCPLVSEEIMNAANGLLEKFRKFENIAPSHSEKNLKQELADVSHWRRDEEGPQRLSLEDALDATLNELRRKHYRIGFLGTQQTGKSALLNQIIGIDELLPEYGSGVSCTSVITNIFFGNCKPEGGHDLPKGDSGPYYLQLKYLSEDEREARKKTYQRDLGLDELPNGQLSRTDFTRFVERQMGQKGRVHKGPKDAKTTGALYGLLTIDCPHYGWQPVQSFNTSEALKCEAWKYLKFLLDQPTENVEFISEAFVWMPAPASAWRADSEKLDLIDLPGMGTINPYDDRMTLECMNTLDGAFLCCSCKEGGLSDDDLSEVLCTFRTSFGELAKKRSWLAITKVDNMPKADFYPNTIVNQPPQFAHNINSFASGHKIGLDRVLLTSSKDAEPLGKSWDPTKEAVPPEVKEHQLEKAWDEWKANRGLDFVRKIILGDDQDSVATQVREVTEQTARAQIKTMAKRLKGAINGLTANIPNLYDRCQFLESAVEKYRVDVGWIMKIVQDQIGQELKTALTDQTGDGPLRLHRFDTNFLKDHLAKLGQNATKIRTVVTNSTIESLFGEIWGSVTIEERRQQKQNNVDPADAQGEITGCDRARFLAAVPRCVEGCHGVLKQLELDEQDGRMDDLASVFVSGGAKRYGRFLNMKTNIVAAEIQQCLISGIRQELKDVRDVLSGMKYSANSQIDDAGDRQQLVKLAGEIVE